MLVFFVQKAHEEENEDIQVNQMALLAELVDLMLVSYNESSLPSRPQLTRPPMRSRPSSMVTFRPC